MKQFKNDIKYLVVSLGLACVILALLAMSKIRAIWRKA